ncbi:hypothetical protein CEXT_813581 [Caerostris extrusa]|uniref:Uncharacterized protein n=1 Tax=Caerostris extrusa TaxID=172846 RepID=A0AAV4YE99_CAEEX|nr:hypothetical protein CEXT_813581 [Caerostris extrusa]
MNACSELTEPNKISREIENAFTLSTHTGSLTASILQIFVQLSGEINFAETAVGLFIIESVSIFTTSRHSKRVNHSPPEAIQARVASSQLLTFTQKWMLFFRQ